MIWDRRIPSRRFFVFSAREASARSARFRRKENTTVMGIHAGDVDDAIPTPNDQSPSDAFSDLFDKAATSVTADLEEDPVEADDETEPPEEPDEPAEPAETEGEPEGEGEPRKPRSLKHKELLEQNTQLQERFSTFEQQFEEQGGFDTVENAVNFYALASDPTKVAEFTQALSGLPHFRQQQAAFFQQALSDPTNRVLGLNGVLQGDFGLQTPISQQQIEKVFEYIVERFNDDAEDFETFLDRSLELADTPERRLARLEAENAKLKSGKTTTTKSTDEAQEPATDVYGRVQAMGDRLDDEQFAAAYDKVAADYGLKPSSKDPVAFKEAKQTMSDVLRIFASYEMRNAKAFEPLLAYWIEGNMEKNPHYENQVRLYGKAMNARVQALIKKISPLFSGVQVPPSKPDKQLGSMLGQQKPLVPPGDKPESRETRGRSPFDDAFDRAASAVR